MLDYSSVLEGTVAGGAAAIALSSIIFSTNFLRNFLLRRQILKQLKRPLLGTGIKGVSIHVQNHLQRPFRVREVSLVGETMNFQLNPTGEIKTSTKQKKFSRKEIKRLKEANGPIMLNGTMAFVSRQQEVSVDEFPTIEPFSEHLFRLPIHFIAQFNENLKGIRFVVEYDNFTGGIEMLAPTIGHSIEENEQILQHFKKEVTSPRFNEKRKMFGLEPIEVTTEDDGSNK